MDELVSGCDSGLSDEKISIHDKTIHQQRTLSIIRSGFPSTIHQERITNRMLNHARTGFSHLGYHYIQMNGRIFDIYR